MRSAKDYLEREAEKLRQEALGITRKAEDENRQLTDDEKAEIESRTAEIVKLKARVQELEDGEKLQKTIEDLGKVVNDPKASKVEGGQAKTIGEAFAKSEAMVAVREKGVNGRYATGAVEIPGSLGFKVNTGFIAESEGDNADVIATNPTRVPGYMGPVEQPLTIAALFGSGTVTSGNSVVVVREVATDNNTAVVAEGDPKPASYFELDPETLTLEKLATMLTVSDEILEDETALASYLNNRLAFFVRQAEEARLMTRLLATPGIGAAAAVDIGGDNDFDAIMAGIVDVRVNGGAEPDALVIHPIDFARASIRRAVGGDGAYFSGGPYSPPLQNPWGLPNTVITTATAQGTAVVGAFRSQAMVWRKGGLSIEATNSHEDYFERNLTAIRAEERLLLAVYRPAAFSVVTLGS